MNPAPPVMSTLMPSRPPLFDAGPRRLSGAQPAHPRLHGIEIGERVRSRHDASTDGCSGGPFVVAACDDTGDSAVERADDLRIRPVVEDRHAIVAGFVADLEGA